MAPEGAPRSLRVPTTRYLFAFSRLRGVDGASHSANFTGVSAALRTRVRVRPGKWRSITHFYPICTLKVYNFQRASTSLTSSGRPGAASLIIATVHAGGLWLENLKPVGIVAQIARMTLASVPEHGWILSVVNRVIH
jgi:hypothetical protein